MELTLKQRATDRSRIPRAAAYCSISPRRCKSLVLPLVLSAEIGSSEREVMERPCGREDRVQDRLLIHTRVLNISATYLWPILTSRERLLLLSLSFSFIFVSLGALRFLSFAALSL